MFGMSISEIVLILAVALIVLGPKNLPKVARKLGSLMGQVQRMTSDLSTAIRQESMDIERSSRMKEEATVVKAEPVEPSNQDGAVPNAEDIIKEEVENITSEKNDIRQVYDKGRPSPKNENGQLWEELYGDKEASDGGENSKDKA